MLGICFALFVFIMLVLAVAAIRKLFGARTIRFLGFELFRLMIVISLISVFIVVFVLPMPQYEIKGSGRFSTADDSSFSLNKILERKAKSSGIRFDAGSFRILDSYGMNLHHLFLCSYQVDGKETVRVFQFEKNIFGNMKPQGSLRQAPILTRSENENDYYRNYISDGIFGGYLVTAGYAGEDTVLKNYRLNHFYMEQLHPSGYFLWIELVDTPWKKFLIQFLLVFAIILIRDLVLRQNNKTAREHTAFYTRWSPGQKFFELIEEQPDHDCESKKI